MRARTSASPRPNWPEASKVASGMISTTTSPLALGSAARCSENVDRLSEGKGELHRHRPTPAGSPDFRVDSRPDAR